jgi:uncharacterized protein (TIGR02145 family)
VGTNNITFSSPTYGGSTFSVTPATIDDASGSIAVTLSAEPSYSVPAGPAELFSIDVFDNGTNVGSIDVKSISGIPMSDGAGGTIVFATHNLGADTSFDPDVPRQEIHGNYYQWGIKEPVSDASQQGNYSGSWDSQAYAAAGSWSDNEKTANDPCPGGWRVPTVDNWDDMIDNNTYASHTGTWDDNDSNYGVAIHYQNGIYELTLPASGKLNNSDGELRDRGDRAEYWSTGNRVSAEGERISWNSGLAPVWRGVWKAFGFSIRCVTE